MANNKISPLAALNRSEGDKRGVSSLKGYGQPSTIGEFLGGFTGAPRRFSVMDPEAAGMQTARDIGEQASVAGQMFGAMTPFAASAAAAKAGQMMGVSPLTVYHGSPHRFSKFDASKIGTGEGAQAYGRGLYFAESPGVAEGYARNLANRDLANQGRLNAHANAQRLVNLAGDPKYAANDIRFVLSNEPDHPQKKLLQDTLVFLESGDFAKPLQNKGSLYTVDIPDEKIAKMLDWDKPFSQQTPEVRKSLQDAGIVGADDWLISGMRGKEIYKRASFGAPVKLPLNQKDDQIYASERLRQAGIPGIRYLDQGSRGVGKGTSNFVVFPGEEEALTILDVKKKGGAVTRRGALSLANGGLASSEVPDTYYPPEDIQRELQVLLNRPQEPRQADFFGRSAPQGIQRRGEPVVNPFRFLQEAGRGALGMEPQMQRGSAAYRAGQALSAGPGAAATLPGKLAGSGADVLAGLAKIDDIGPVLGGIGAATIKNPMEKEIFKVADELPNKNQFIDQQTLNPDVTGDINERILSVAAPSAVSGQRALQQTIPSNLQSIQTVQLPSGKFATTTEFSTVKPVRTGFEFAKTPDQVAHLTAGLRKSPQEQLVAVVLDKDDRPIQIIRHTIGVSNQAAAELWSLVGAIANTEGAKSYYISHNHPSGVSTLSNPDKNLNFAIDYLTKNTNIENKGIMAVGGGNFSFASPSGQEIINQKITPAIRDKSINMVERTFRKSQVLDKNSISNDNDAKIIADKVAGNETGLLLLNNQYVPVGFLQVDKNKLTNLRKSGESTNILKALEKTNAGNAIFVTKENLSKDQIQNLEKLFNATGANLLSVLTGQQRVASATGTTSRDFLSVAPVGAGVLYGAQEDQKKKGGAVKSSLDMTGMNLFDILRTV